MQRSFLLKLTVLFLFCFLSKNTFAVTKSLQKSYSYSLATPPDSLVVIAPNVFTPNGDGVNDFWSMIIHDYGVAILDMEAIVYDRWGKEMFHTTNVHQVWNGHNTIGKPCDAGTYFFVVSYTNGATHNLETHKGFVELLR